MRLARDGASPETPYEQLLDPERIKVRQRYNITQADCCDGEANMFDDFCSVYWCMPCTLVQEARQIRGGKK